MLVCPSCQAPGLAITQGMKLRANMDWDERALQALRCPACGAHFRGMYQEERRGSRERFSHTATGISADVFIRLSDALQSGDARLARDIAAEEAGEAAYLQYRPPDGATPLSRANASQFPAPAPLDVPTTVRPNWVQRLGRWLKN